ncbi:MAG: peptidylprolyl isomerase [Bacteroidia bacterium]|nr:peptidylprolyl isomerase [Bacteroidia bacterium]
MAIINRIRKYSALAITLIALSIAAFVLADMLGPGGAVFGGGKQYIGEINGVDISYEEFDQQVNMLSGQYQLTSGQAPNEAQMISFREQAWNNLVYKYAYEEQFDKLGITVSDKELTEMVQGDSLFIHPWVRQQFANRETNQFDPSLVRRYLQNLSNMPPEQSYVWANFENELRKERRRTKYQDLLTLSNYVTQAEAERFYTGQNSQAQVKYLYIPFASIADSLVEAQITDARLQEYLDTHEDQFEAEETRSLEYVKFDIKPSKEDSAAFFQDLKQLAKDFKNVPNDSTFAAINSDDPSLYLYQSPSQLPAIIFDKNPEVLKGKVYGPYVDGDKYKIFKVSNIREDSAYAVRARHILVRSADTDPQEKQDEARERAQNLLKRLQEGANFEALARSESDDPGSAIKGGDLGFFGEGQMVKSFNDAAFAPTEPGLINELVKSEYGYHIIEVTHPKTNKNYLMATIAQALDPSEQTRNEVLLQAEEFRTEVENLENFRAVAEKNPALTIQTADRLPANATNLGEMSGAREVVRWAFNEAEEGDISDVFEVQDLNVYIIAALTNKAEKGVATVDMFRDQLKAEVLKEIKTKQIKAKLDTKVKSLDQMAKKYGEGAEVNSADLSLGTNSFGNLGFNPIAVGKAFALKKGQRTQAFGDETGVFIIELNNFIPAPKIADYTQYKTQLMMPMEQQTSFMVDQAIREAAEIEDERYKVY